MSDVNEFLIIDCPPGRAQSYLVKHFEDAAERHGKAVLPLTATIGQGTGAKVKITREALATIAPATVAGGLEYQVRIEWTPASKEPLPTFDGVFRVQWDEDYGKCRLVLEGSYEPPLGIIGKAFDAALGHKIAQETARSLLERLRTEIETARREEMEK
jgi:hypothetical protein